MQHEPVRVTDAREWLTKADADLRAAEVDMGASPPLREDALFHFQQAVEKTLKGFLTLHDRPFRKTHDLLEIGKQCVEVEPSLEPLLRQAAVLTEFAWKYRYPGDSQEPLDEEVNEARILAQAVSEAIRRMLPPEVQKPPDPEAERRQPDNA